MDVISMPNVINQKQADRKKRKKNLLGFSHKISLSKVAILGRDDNWSWGPKANK